MGRVGKPPAPSFFIMTTAGYIPLNRVPKLRWIPGRGQGGRIGLATVYRWAQKGIKGRKLRTVRIGGGCWATTEQWLHEFFAALASPGPAPVKVDGRGFNAAEEELDRMGIGRAA